MTLESSFKLRAVNVSSFDGSDTTNPLIRPQPTKNSITSIFVKILFFCIAQITR